MEKELSQKYASMNFSQESREIGTNYWPLRHVRNGYYGRNGPNYL